MRKKVRLTKREREILSVILDRQRTEQKRLEHIAKTPAYSDHDFIKQDGVVDGLRTAAGELIAHFGL